MRAEVDTTRAERCHLRSWLRGALEDVRAPGDLEVGESGGHDRGLELCLQQSSGDSPGPQIDVPFGALRHRCLDGDVGDLQPATGAQDAEDLAQQTFIKAYKNLHRFDTSRPLAGWLLTIARNALTDHLRKERPSERTQRPLDGVSEGELPAEEGPAEGLGLEPALAWRSQVALAKTLSPGESTGYGRRFVAERPTRIGVVPVGYADGFRRGLTGTEVLVDGARRRVVGAISMDSFAVELGAEPEGAVVTLLGDGVLRRTPGVRLEIGTGPSARNVRADQDR